MNIRDRQVMSDMSFREAQSKLDAGSHAGRNHDANPYGCPHADYQSQQIDGAVFDYCASQFLTFRPGTRENSPVLAVTTVSPNESAWAAMSMSFGPMGVP